MRFLLVGDAAVSTGFARCTHTAANALHAAGHEVTILGINYHGDPHPYPYPIYPCRQPFDYGHDSMGQTRLPRIIQLTEPDVVLLLNDPWNIADYLDSMDARLADDFPRPAVVGWLAVDAMNQHGAPLNRLDHVVVWTEFAKRELSRGGCTRDIDIVPLGVDTDIFKPTGVTPGTTRFDRSEARRRVVPPGFMPDGAFLVGAIGRNQSRKRLDLTLSYFSRWINRFRRDDAYLLLHVGPTGEKRGVDYRSLVRYFELQGRVMVIEPEIGHGVDDTIMPYVYSSLDVYVTTTQGEGWGLPALEAMACGVPCVVPDFAGLGSWAGDAAARVPCSAIVPTAPINAMMHTLGAVPNESDFVSELDALYASPIHYNALVRRGLRLAGSLSWASTGDSIRRILESVAEARASAPDAASEVTSSSSTAESQGVGCHVADISRPGQDGG